MRLLLVIGLRRLRTFFSVPASKRPDILAFKPCRNKHWCRLQTDVPLPTDPRAKLVTVAIRYWANRRSLAGGDPNPMKMPSCCLTLLVVTFLQQLNPPVLPSVDWSVAGTLSTAGLLV